MLTLFYVFLIGGLTCVGLLEAGLNVPAAVCLSIVWVLGPGVGESK